MYLKVSILNDDSVRKTIKAIYINKQYFVEMEVREDLDIFLYNLKLRTTKYGLEQIILKNIDCNNTIEVIVSIEQDEDKELISKGFLFDDDDSNDDLNEVLKIVNLLPEYSLNNEIIYKKLLIDNTINNITKVFSQEIIDLILDKI